MMIKTLKNCLPYLMQAKISAFLWAGHGVGKSQSAKQFADENGYKFVYLNPGTMDVGDLLGLADFAKNEKGHNVSTKFMNPDWLVEIVDYCNKNPKSAAIIMVDELNRARRDVIQALFPLVLENRMHTTYLPQNCYVMAAGNPNSEDYIVTDITDKAFISRFCHIRLAPSKAEWLEYAESINTSLEVTNFIKEQPELLEASIAEFSLEDVKPNRRAWMALDRLYQAKTPLNLLQELAAGLVGHAAAIAWLESLKNSDKPLSAEEVLKKFGSIEDKLIKWSDSKKGNRLDLLKTTGDNVVNYIKKKDTKLSKTEEKNLLAFLKVIPKDLSFNLARILFLIENTMKLLSEDKELTEMYEKAKNPTT